MSSVFQPGELRCRRSRCSAVQPQGFTLVDRRILGTDLDLGLCAISTWARPLNGNINEQRPNTTSISCTWLFFVNLKKLIIKALKHYFMLIIICRNISALQDLTLMKKNTTCPCTPCTVYRRRSSQFFFIFIKHLELDRPHGVRGKKKASCSHSRRP